VGIERPRTFSPIYGIMQSLNVAIPIEPKKPTRHIVMMSFLDLWIWNSDAVTNALRKTCPGWKMPKRMAACGLLMFLKMSMKMIPVIAPPRVKGACDFNSMPMCLILPIMLIGQPFFVSFALMSYPIICYVFSAVFVRVVFATELHFVFGKYTFFATELQKDL